MPIGLLWQNKTRKSGRRTAFILFLASPDGGWTRNILYLKRTEESSVIPAQAGMTGMVCRLKLTPIAFAGIACNSDSKKI
jgi:hypothetical protein